MTKNVFVVGLDGFHRDLLETVEDADRYRFHELLPADDIINAIDAPINELIDRAKSILDGFDGRVDAIIGHWDFPTSTILPILRKHRGLSGPSLEAVLKCEHKYWSRLEQKKVVPEHVPAFAAFDPFDENPRVQIDIAYPFWIKPIKSHSSFLGFKIDSDEDFSHAIKEIRKKIEVVARPFNSVLEYADLPSEIAAIDGYHCIAEEIISAKYQCTLEGYCLNGDCEIYGTVDSGRVGKHGSSFSHYGYPSAQPDAVRDKMKAIAGKVLKSIGYDQSPFNVEFFYDDATEAMHLLEINPRISKSHCPLFLLVDGASHHQVVIRTALGEEPDFPRRKGDFPYAAKFMMRHMGPNARVEHAPNHSELDHLQHDFPELRLKLHVETGMRLSDLAMQDSYSFELADVFLGGDNPEAVQERYERCRAEIPITLDSRKLALT